MGMVFNMAGGPPLPLLTSPGSAGDLRAGTQLIDNNGDVLTGTLPEVEQATPTISVSDGGLITASANQAGGIVSAGSKNATGQLATQAAKTVTPGTTQQTAVPAGVYTTGAVTVAGDANLVPENIAEGVSIFGVTGTLAGGGIEWVPINSLIVQELATQSETSDTPVLRAAPIYSGIEVSVDVDSSVRAILLMNTMSNDYQYIIVSIFCTDNPQNGSFSDGTEVGGFELPFASTSTGYTRPTFVSNGQLTLYVGSDYIDYCYYAKLSW